MMLTALPVLPQATRRSVCLESSAGTWSDIDHLGRSRRLCRRMDVRKDGHAEALLHFPQDREALLDPRSPEIVDGGPVRLVVGRLEDEGETEPARNRCEALRRSASVASLSSITQGPPMNVKGLPPDLLAPGLHFFLHFAFSCLRLSAAFMNSRKSGWGLKGFDLNSGWNWHPRNQGWSFSSTISTSVSSGEMPVTSMPQVSSLLPVPHVELVAVAVPLVDQVLVVSLVGAASRFEPARVGAEPHRAALVGGRVPRLHLVVPVNPLLHEVDDRAVRLLVELRAVGAFHLAEVPRGLYHGKLHPEADAEIGYLVLPRVGDRVDLPLDAPRAEAAGHQYAVDAAESACTTSFSRSSEST